MLKFSNEGLRDKIASDPDVECEAGNIWEIPMAAMRAKMKINHIDKRNEGQETLYFNPVSRSDSYPADGSDENNTYAKFTPSGMLSLTVCNPVLLGKFNEGEEYYLDFIKAPQHKM